MANTIARPPAWSVLKEDELLEVYKNLQAKLAHLPSAQLTLIHEPANNELTHAENIGMYVREQYKIYSAALKEMRSSQQWIALQVRSTYHSVSSEPESILVGEEQPGQKEIRGVRFDPLISHWWITPWTFLDSP